MDYGDVSVRIQRIRTNGTVRSRQVAYTNPERCALPERCVPGNLILEAIMRTLIGRECLCARMVRRWRLIAGAAVLLAASLAAASASAELMLADFVAQPPSPSLYELVWNGSVLDEGPGAKGNGYGSGGGDGNLLSNLQTAPGLLVQAPYSISGLPGGVVDTTAIPQSTYFSDATLILSPVGGGSGGIPQNGAAQTTTIGSMTIVSQPLGSGQFQVFTTDLGNPILLLAGSIESAAITGILGSASGSVLSAQVTYTGGAIWTAAGSPQTGEFSWSMEGVTPHFSKSVTSGFLAPFSANGTGQFTAADPVPEPGTLVLLSIAGLGLAGFVCRRRRTA
jgi:hypothetical protein